MKGYQNGTFSAFVKDCGVTETKGGALQVFIIFDVEFYDGESQTHYRVPMTWKGNLQEGKPLEITNKALIAAGFTGMSPEDLAAGMEGGHLQAGYEVQVVIEAERSQTDANKMFHVIRWVNKPGGTVNVKRIDPAVVKAKLADRNLAAQLDAQRQKEGDPSIGF